MRLFGDGIEAINYRDVVNCSIAKMKSATAVAARLSGFPRRSITFFDLRLIENQLEGSSNGTKYSIN